LDQLKVYTSETYDSFQRLADTGCVEFLSGTYSYSLSSLYSQEAFSRQVTEHRMAMEDLTGRTSEIFFNTGLLYDDEVGEKLAGKGFKGIITEGAKHILGWKSPNTLYTSAKQPFLKLFFRQPKLSHDLSFNFSDPAWGEHPLTPEKYLSRILSTGEEEKLINLVIPYETFGHIQPQKSGIFNFMDHFIFLATHSPEIRFGTPTEIVGSFYSGAMIQVPNPVSWNGVENNLSEWSNNELQQEALSKLYDLSSQMTTTSNPDLLTDWHYLQTADHFSYMSTQHLSGLHENYKNPFGSPFEAFINYMNILNDFKIRLDQYSKE
jgi:alpha-amylase